MKVVILCGGLGTRLREETEYKPKPMVEVGGRPILWHIMKTYAHHGFHEFVCCLGYKGSVIKEYFLNYEAMNNNFTITLGKQNRIKIHSHHDEADFQVTLVETGAEAMTGARIKRAEAFVDGDLFMATYGDGLCDVDISALVEFHKSHGKIGTMTTVRPVSRFGLLKVDKDHHINEFIEKPRLESWINAGYFVFNRKFFDYLDDHDSCVLEKSPLEKLARDGQLVGYRHDGFFFAMDTYREYMELCKLWDSRQAPWAVWKK
ncbi:MAG: glucose-1-phosphate cytidylyltransferase [Verrucomicrobiae bacterium]|nr:glucose-1-phosphate cytidylyltransferase [Verrucomicrobiae bacterium]